MDLLLTAGRLLLAGALIFAAASKFSRRSQTADAMRAFGVPAQLVGAGVWVLPGVELIVGLLLLPEPTARPASAAALLLLAAFSLALARALLQGQAVECNCFGALSRGPVSWRTLGRNAALALPAAAVLIGGSGAGLPGVEIAPWSTLGIVLALQAGLAAVLIALAVFTWQLLRQQGRMLLRIAALEGERDRPAKQPAERIGSHAHGLPVGVAAPPLTLSGPDGASQSLTGLLAPGRPLLLVFLSARCPECRRVAPELPRLQGTLAGRVEIVALVRPDRSGAAQDPVGTGGIAQWDVDAGSAAAYDLRGTPSAVLVSAEGRIAAPLAEGTAEIVALAERLVTERAGAADPGVRFSLPAPDGTVLTQHDLAGRASVLLFWNAACPFCHAMLDDLRAVEDALAADDSLPRLVLVSSSFPPESDRVTGLRSTFLLDRTFSLGRTVGAKGTPSGVLIDADGHLASDVRAGSESVLDLFHGSLDGGRQSTAGGGGRW